MTREPLAPALRAILAPIDAEGVETVREQLVLWLIRSRYEIGDADSYASILSDRELFPGTEVDAVLVTTRRDIITPVYVLFAEDDSELSRRVAVLADALRAETAPEARLAKANSQLRSLFEPATDRRITADVSRLILGICRSNVRAAEKKKMLASASGIADVDIIDENFIVALAEADTKPTASMPEVLIAVDRDAILGLGVPGTEALIAPVPASQVAEWPGIADRTLFDLNVRFGLGLNRVRRSLDEALQDTEAAEHFIAYHNGITAVCSDFDVTDSGIRIAGLSVVNGAQTVVAINANREKLAPGLRVLFKLVKADPDSELAKNIAIRSNTQNPVTSRNLRALDEVQARLQADLGKLGYVYTRRPSDQPAAGQVIRNDDVAQLLCSIYVRKPAIAVKRQVLFENPTYSEIFPSDIDATRVIFATLIREEVENHKSEVPEEYQKAWALTALTLVNMTSEAMRDDPRAARALSEPGDAIKDPLQAQADIAPFVQAACSVLHKRAATLAEKQLPDEFKVAFKQTRTLGELALETSKEYRNAQRSASS
ncbi:Possible abortive infection phage resistance protein [Microbacterium esteraromaticum]|uniref:Possible abortive infection phage resistance protein n=1 Tax=Microbacterium esteraromaticum TaxID=57043 RepID=A0A1R4KIB5_9MICO|nr:AIPR family protein [Microbacterium esteraromaticum]SJN43969.1 Possible abortive infection phage resistance protein [Microbacterium esteraromaticum]